ncbi:hypothetical protein GGQ64_003311 [Rhizobium azooxidifex]|uniref:Uncharacterized protein n=1 Tax=Mycoplana azooxidifex TaxID=1636188 RepID=A0A7W6D8Q2_9HYPH|nr:hypothetical protein [Mycoplana azooxidifex]
MGARIQRRAGHGKDEAAEIGGIARRDQGAGAVGGLDDHEPEADAGDQPVAARKIARPGLPAERHLADGEAVAGGDLLHQADIFGWIGLVKTARHRRDRSRGKARAMGGRIDPAGKPGDDGITGSAQVPRQHAGELRAGDRCVAGADDADGEVPGDPPVALHRKQRRGSVDLAQECWVVRLADTDEGCAVPLRYVEFALGLGAARDPDRPDGAAAAGKLRQHLQRRLGRAAMVDQVAEGDGADIVAADQPQPGDPLSVRKRNSLPACAL